MKLAGTLALGALAAAASASPSPAPASHEERNAPPTISISYFNDTNCNQPAEVSGTMMDLITHVSDTSNCFKCQTVNTGVVPEGFNSYMVTRIPGHHATDFQYLSTYRDFYCFSKNIRTTKLIASSVGKCVDVSGKGKNEKAYGMRVEWGAQKQATT